MAATAQREKPTTRIGPPRRAAALSATAYMVEHMEVRPELLTLIAPLPSVHGDAKLSLDAYWQSAAASEAWGVLEVSTDVTKGSYYGTSIFWGLQTQEDAELVSHLGNAIHRSYDRARHQTRQLVPFSRPPCTISVAISGDRTLHLAVSNEFPVRQQPARWTEITLIANEHYFLRIKKPLAAEDRRAMAHISELFKGINKALPIALFDTVSTGCYLSPEGLTLDSMDAAAIESDSSSSSSSSSSASSDDEENSDASAKEDDDDDDDDDNMFTV